jgi:hypothetical protein
MAKIVWHTVIKYIIISLAMSRVRWNSEIFVSFPRNWNKNISCPLSFCAVICVRTYSISFWGAVRQLRHSFGWAYLKLNTYDGCLKSTNFYWRHLRTAPLLFWYLKRNPKSLMKMEMMAMSTQDEIFCTNKRKYFLRSFRVEWIKGCCIWKYYLNLYQFGEEIFTD